jgi:hypothetical protein
MTPRRMSSTCVMLVVEKGYNEKRQSRRRKRPQQRLEQRKLPTTLDDFIWSQGAICTGGIPATTRRDEPGAWGTRNSHHHECSNSRRRNNLVASFGVGNPSSIFFDRIGHTGRLAVSIFPDERSDRLLSILVEGSCGSFNRISWHIRGGQPKFVQFLDIFEVSQ